MRTKLIQSLILIVLFSIEGVHAQGSTPPHPPQEAEKHSEYQKEDYYPSPGVRAKKGNIWVGSDHLFNLTSEIGVIAELIIPGAYKGPSITEEQIRQWIIRDFEKGRISPEPKYQNGKPPLPFFHLVLFIYPVENGAVLFCAGRLFEEVDFKRVITPEDGALQAITWEKQTMLFAKENEIKEQAEKSVNDVVNGFVDRFSYFESLKSRTPS